MKTPGSFILKKFLLVASAPATINLYFHIYNYKALKELLKPYIVTRYQRAVSGFWLYSTNLKVIVLNCYEKTKSVTVLTCIKDIGKFVSSF